MLSVKLYGAKTWLIKAPNLRILTILSIIVVPRLFRVQLGTKIGENVLQLGICQKHLV